MKITKKDVAKFMDNWWFSSAVFWIIALLFWVTGVNVFYVGALTGMGVMSFVRLFWAPKGDRQGITPD